MNINLYNNNDPLNLLNNSLKATQDTTNSIQKKKKEALEKEKYKPKKTGEIAADRLIRAREAKRREQIKKLYPNAASDAKESILKGNTFSVKNLTKNNSLINIQEAPKPKTLKDYQNVVNQAVVAYDNKEKATKARDELLSLRKIDSLYADYKNDEAIKVLETYKPIVQNFYTKNYNINNKDQFNELWNGSDIPNKFNSVVEVLANKYMNKDQLDMFSTLDSKSKVQMLCATITNMPGYETKAKSLREETKNGVDKFYNGIDNIFNASSVANHLAEDAQSIVTTGYSAGVLKTYNIMKQTDPKVAEEYLKEQKHGLFSRINATAYMAVDGIGSLLYSLDKSLTNTTVGYLRGESSAEDEDKKLNEISNKFVSTLAAKYRAIFESKPEGEEAYQKQRKEIIEQMKSMSDELSPYYKLHKGDHYTNNVTDEDLINQFFTFMANGNVFGNNAAVKGVQDYWQNTVASNQDSLDKTGRMFNQMATTFVADALGFTSVLLTAAPGMGAYTEGYSDAMIKNPLLEYASNLQQTGCWTFKQQEKYKELGLSNTQMYRTTDEENELLGYNDLFDAVGQYGFTAATTLISMGGSTVVKGIAKGLSKGALKKLTAKAIANGMSRAELIAAQEKIAAKLSSRLYYGNQILAGLSGTSEGALEARSTYETFIKDNKDKIDQNYKIQIKNINEATKEQLDDFMYASGFTADQIAIDSEMGIAKAGFTDKQYKRARQMLLQEVQESYQAALDRLEDDALDAGCANFIANSLINGFLNVTLKEATLSNDARNSLRSFRGRGRFSDYVTIGKNAKGEWEAIINNAKNNNSLRNWWSSSKTAFKQAKGFGAKTKAIYTGLKESTVGQAVKQALGEALEEYEQGVSDSFSRAALQADLNGYLETVYNKNERDNFVTDFHSMVVSGMKDIADNAFSQENIKAALMGALSTSIGGISPAHLISNLHGLSAADKELTGVKKALAWGKTILSNIGNLYDGGLRQAYNTTKGETATAERLQQSMQRWLGSEKNQQLFTHMGGAIGFNNLIKQSLLADDHFTAENNKLGLAVENAIILEAFKGTAFYDVQMQLMQQRAVLGRLAYQEEEKNKFFDEFGALRGEQQLIEGDNLTEEQQKQNEVIKEFNERRTAIANLIDEFSAYSQENKENKSDFDKLMRIAKNAKEALDFQLEMEAASKRLDQIFVGQEVDPTVKSALIYAKLAGQNAEKRYNSIKQKLETSVSLDNENLTEEDKKVLEANDDESLNKEGLALSLSYGSLDKAIKELKKAKQEEANAATTASNKNKTREERNEAKQKSKQLAKFIDALTSRLLNAGVALEELQIKQEQEQSAEDATVRITEGTQTKNKPLISIKDMAAMDSKQLSQLLEDRDKKFSEEQNQLIDQFLDIITRSRRNSEFDDKLSQKEVEQELKDLSKLKRMSDAYSKYLSDYIRNPRWLSDRAGALRYEDRIKTLKYIYRQELTLKQDETVLELQERVNKKIQELKDQNKYQDAQILQNLLYENKEYGRMINTNQEIYAAITIIKRFGKAFLKKHPDINLARAAAVLRTLTMAGRLTFAQLEQILKTNNAQAKKLLTTKLQNGGLLLDKELTQVGEPTVPTTISEDELYTQYLQPALDIVNFYVTAKRSITQRSESTAVTGKPSLPKGVDEASNSTNANSTTKPTTKPTVQSTEPKSLIISSPGDLDTSSEIFKYLESKGATQAVQNLDGIKVSKSPIYYIVTKELGKPYIIMAQQVEGNNSKGNLIKINGKYYQPIGVIKGGQSSILDAKAQEAYNNLNNDEATLLSTESGNPLFVDQFKNIKDTKPVGDIAQGDETKFKSLFAEDTRAENEWITDLIGHGKQEKGTENSESQNTLKDHNGYPIIIKNDQDQFNSVRSFKIGDRTVQEIIDDSTLTEEQKIKELEKNEFFKEFFDSWANPYYLVSNNLVGASTQVKASSIFSQLIGSFIYLGTTKNYSKKEGITLEYNAETSTLTITNKVSNEAITIGVPSTSGENNKIAALKALIQVSDGSMEYDMPNINWDVISGKERFTDKSLQRKEAHKVKGLIDAGLLWGYLPVTSKKYMQITNPYKQSSSSKSSTSNVGTTQDNPTGSTSNTVNLQRGGSVDKVTEEISGDTRDSRQIVEDLMKDASEEAKTVINNMMEASQEIADPTEEGYVNKTTNKVGVRVTTTEAAAGGTKYEGQQGDTISTAIGNVWDTFYRYGLERLQVKDSANGENISKAKQYLAKLKSIEQDINDGKISMEAYNKAIQSIISEITKGTLLEKGIPNYDTTSNAFMSTVVQMLQFVSLCEDYGWILIPQGIKTMSDQPVFNDAGEQIGTLSIGGTLDILVYDKNTDQFHIIDMKTKNTEGERLSTAIAFSNKNWNIQTSIYEASLQQQYPGINFGHRYIMPLGVNYLSMSDAEIAEDKMTVTDLKQPLLSAAKMLPMMQGREDTELETMPQNFLIELTGPEFTGYSYSKMDEELKSKVNPISITPVEQETPIPEKKTEESKPVTAPRRKRGNINATAVNNKSQRTKQSAYLTDFINRHIANISTPKLNIIGKAIGSIKKVFSKSSINKVIKQSLADAFFNGNLTQFEAICGKDISKQVLPEIIQKLKVYYSTYLTNRQSYIQNITKRHEAAKAVYKFLTGGSMAELEDALSKLQVKAQDIPELIEYLNAKDSEKAKVELLNRMYNSGLHTEAHYQRKLNEFTEFLDGMQAKLDFINSSSALNMLTNKIESIRTALISNTYEETNNKVQNTLQSLLQGKQGIYGAIKLLREIATNSNNQEFKRIAAKLINQIKANKLSIVITLDDGSISTIEGETNDKHITIFKAALSSQERLERVLLHECLHAAIEVSPEIKKQLQEQLNNIISQLQRTTGKTKEELINEHYGLTNVDEFISEYFTNLAFQESLRNIDDITGEFNSIFDHIVYAVKNFFTSKPTAFDKVSSIMESLIESHNTEDVTKTKSNVDTNSDFNGLSDIEKAMVTKRGFTAKEFDSLPSDLKKLLKECCA